MEKGQKTSKQEFSVKSGKQPEEYLPKRHDDVLFGLIKDHPSIIEGQARHEVFVASMK